MSVFPSRTRLRQMIDQAMRDQAPQFRRQLLMQGRLQAEIEQRMELFDEIQSGLLNQEWTRIHKEANFNRPLGVAAAAGEAARQSVEQALAVVLEFPTTEQNQAA